MAPEYIDKGIITKKLDIFSLGVIIIEIMRGCKDYPDETETSSKQYIELVRESCFIEMLLHFPLYMRTKLSRYVLLLCRCLTIGETGSENHWGMHPKT